jgi:hypothetical protein
MPDAISGPDSESSWTAGLTFSLDPEKRSCRLPRLKDVALNEPGCLFPVEYTTGDVVVHRGVWWGEPFVNIVRLPL